MSIDYIDYARRVMRDIDKELAMLEAQILIGAFPDWPTTQRAIGLRTGLRNARAIARKNLTPEDQKDTRVNGD